MSYLAELKQLESEKFSAYTPDIEPSKPSKGGSVGFVGTYLGACREKNSQISDEQQTPVTVAGRTFRKCRACGRMGWHPQADAEVCCGQAMEMIGQPAMTVPEYVNFTGCPKAYASGAITHADILEMMRQDHIQPLPDNEKAVSGDYVR